MSSSLTADYKSYAFLTEQLDAKHKMYIEARARGSTPVVAARMAGFRDPDVDSGRLEKDMIVRAAIESAVRMQVHQLKITKQNVIEGMLDAIRVAATATEQIAGWREIGKLINAYDPEPPAKEKDVTATKEQIAEMSDEELARQAAIEGDFQVVDFKPVKPNAD